MIRRERVLRVAAKVIEELGRRICESYEKYEEESDVLYNFILILTPVEYEISLLRKILARIEVIWERFEKKAREDEDFRKWTEGRGPFKDRYKEIVRDILMGEGFTPSEMPLELVILTITLGGMAQSIFGMLKLWKEIKDEGYDFRDLYKYFKDKYGPNALRRMISRLKEIPKIGEVRALTFLREYAIRSGSDLPLRELPIPDSRIIGRVMRRMGFVESERTSEIREAGRRYFKVPIIAAAGLEYIGYYYCYETGPLCDECPLEALCEWNIEWYWFEYWYI